MTGLSTAQAPRITRDGGRSWGLESHLQRLATAINSTSDVVILTDAEFRLTFVNDAFHAATGYTLEDALGRPFGFLAAPSSTARLGQCLDCLRRGISWTGEWLNIRSNGASYPVETAVSPIYSKHGQLLGYSAIERDITLHKRLQDEVRRERDYALSIVNSLDAAVYSLDRDFRITHVNQGWHAFPPEHGGLRLDGPPSVGRCLLDYVVEADRRTELAAIFTCVLAHGHPQELELASPDERRWHIKIAPWRLASEIVGLIFVVTDQTRLHDLQRQLFQVQKMETIGTLAAGVAHDFNNLLTAIRGNASLLQMDESLQPPFRLRLQKIDQAAARAADITRQLLTFSRPDPRDEAVVDLNDIIREAAELSQRTLHAHIRILLQPADRPARVRLGASRAQQILLNLCVNAHDAMTEGGQLTLSNSFHKLTAEQASRIHRVAGADFIRCTVADTGTGMPPELVARIFDPFFTTKGQGKGSGLGLSIVHSVVTHAGGLVELQTAPGQGTSFHIYLPEAEPQTEPDAAESPDNGLPARRGSGRILVVDDLELVLDYTRSVLEECGYEVIPTASAEEAVAILEREPAPVDLVFTDYNMTGKSGLDLIREVAQRWPHTKFVLVSGYLSDALRQEIESNYPARILDKPFTLAQATSLISQLLDSTPPASSA